MKSGFYELVKDLGLDLETVLDWEEFKKIVTKPVAITLEKLTFEGLKKTDSLGPTIGVGGAIIASFILGYHFAKKEAKPPEAT